MLFTRLSGVARQGRKATQGEAGNMKKSRSKRAESPSELIDARIEDLDDWRGRDALPAPRPDQGGRPRSGRGVEVERDSSLVAQRADLHRRDVQECREDDLRQGSLPEGPFKPLQFQSRRQRQARHRLPRRRQAGRGGPEGSHSGRRGLEQVFSPRLVRKVDPPLAPRSALQSSAAAPFIYTALERSASVGRAAAPRTRPQPPASSWRRRLRLLGGLAGLVVGGFFGAL